jgi:hypothetical protein
LPASALQIAFYGMNCEPYSQTFRKRLYAQELRLISVPTDAISQLL